MLTGMGRQRQKGLSHLGSPALQHPRCALSPSPPTIPRMEQSLPSFSCIFILISSPRLSSQHLNMFCSLPSLKTKTENPYQYPFFHLTPLSAQTSQNKDLCLLPVSCFPTSCPAYTTVASLPATFRSAVTSVSPVQWTSSSPS